MTMTPIKEAARALSLDARRALLNTNPEVGANVPSTTFVTDDALWQAQAMRGDGRLTPFGLMLREAVLELELDTMDPPDVPEVRGMADPYADNVRELVAAAREWFAVRRGQGDLERHEVRLWKAIRGLS